MPRADSQPGTAQGPRRLLPTEALHPRSLPTRALPFAAPTAPSRRDGGGRGYEPGLGEHPPQSASASGRTPPHAPFPSAPPSTPARGGSAQSGPLRAPALPGRRPAPPPRRLVRFPRSDWLRRADWAGPGGAGAEEGALSASFVTLLGLDPAYWLQARARSRCHAQGPGEGGSARAAATGTAAVG